MEKMTMQNTPDNKETQEEKIQETREEIKFGYGASIVFLIFITFVVYVTLTK